MKKISVILAALLLAGCAQQTQVTSKERKPFNIKQGEKRLNTAECHDIDDWYLDGFRVGTEHSAHRQSLLEQRISYCSGQINVSEQMKNAWNDGFEKSLKKSHKPSKYKIKKKKYRH